MTTHRIDLTFTWDRRAAVALALTVALPLALVTGLLSALAARPPAAPASPALSSPTTLSYQGQVSVGAQPFSGQGQFKFAIVNSAGSAAFWTNDGTSLGSAPFQPASAVQLTVTAGLFNVLLGDASLLHMTLPIGSGVFLQPGRALRVWFNDGAHGFQQLAPDVPLAAVPYALNAETLDGLDSSAFLTQSGADARYARSHPTTQQIALLKWYTTVTGAGSTFETGDFPASLAFDGANMWVENSVGGSVSVLRASDGFHIMTPTVTGQGGIAFDGANMWIADVPDGRVNVLRASDGLQVMTVTVGNNPQGVAFDGANVWVANNLDGSVSVLRASDGFHVMTPTVGADPVGLAFDGANMWVANSLDGNVSVLRASDGFHVMTPTVDNQPTSMAFDGANMWVTNRVAGTVSVLRASDGFHVMTPTVGIQPNSIAFDGANMWVANLSAATVSILRASDGAHIITPTIGTAPGALAFDGAFMWVTDPATDKVSKH